MRTIALLSLLLAVCQLYAGKVPAFDKGKRYIYEYRGRVATGVSDDVHQLSGFGFIAKVWVQNDNDDVVMKITDAKMGTINGKLEHLMDEIPMDYKDPEGAKAAMSQEVQKPFWVEYDDGKIKALYFDKTDMTPEWNVKKALATLFQTDFKRSVEHLHMYKVKEDGIGGICDTYYKVGHYPDDDTPDNVEVMNVTKTRDYENCEYKPHLLHASYIGEECKHCSQENFEPLRKVAQTIYEIKGTREDFTIEHIESYGGIVLTPFTNNGQSAYSVVNQTLTLVKVEDATPISKPGSLEKVTSLSYTFHNDHRDHETVDLKEAHYYDKIYEKEYPQRMTEAESLWNEMKAVFKEYGKESKYVWKFVKLFQKFSYDDWVQFFNKHVHNSEDKGMKSFIWEIVPLVGTNPSIVFGLEMIESGKVTKTDAYEMIQKIPFYVKEPSMKLLTWVKTFGGKPSVTEDKKLFSASRLAYGTMIFRACKDHYFNPHPHDSKTYITADKCKTMVQELIAKYKTLGEDAMRSIYLRAIANTRTEEAFNFLIWVIEDENADTLLRQAAVWTIRIFDDEKYEPKILEAVGPIYKDVNEDYVLRIYAFEVLMYTAANPAFFGSLIPTMTREPNEKLKSYIYATLTTFANSTDPCDQYLVPHAENVLQFLDHYERDSVRDSVNRVFSVYNEKYNYGRSTYMAMIPSNTSVFPRELYMSQHINLMGKTFDFFEIGYTTQGYSMADMIFGKQLGPKGLYGKYGQTLNNPTLKEVVDKLGLKDSVSHEMKDYEIWMSVFNQDVFVTRDLRTDLQDRSHSAEFNIEDGKLNLNVHSVAYMTSDHLFPNEMGLPVSFKVDVPLAYHIGGQARLTPKLDDHTIKGISADFNLHTVVDFSMYSHLSVEDRVFEHYGYVLRTKGAMKLPLKGSVDIDFATKKTAFKYIPSTESYNMFEYDTQPYTTGDNVWEPIHWTETPTNKQYDCGHDYYGVGFTHNFTYDYYWNDFGSYRHFLKSFFKKSTHHDDYFYLSDKWYAGTRSFIDYALLNPTGRPFHYNMRYSPSTNSPTTEFTLTTEKSYNKKMDSARGQEVFKYNAVMIGKGPVERKWTLDAHVSSVWPERDARKVILTWKRSPLPNYDSEGYEVCYQGDILYTDWAKVYTSYPNDLKIQWKGRLNMGKSCEGGDAKTITVSAVAEKSEEQLSVEKNSLYFYKKCQELSKKGQELNHYCWKMIKDHGRIDKVTIDIEHKNIPEKVKGHFYRWYSWVRHYFYDNLEIDPFKGSNEENHIKIHANVSYHYPLLDVKVIRPHKTVWYRKVYIPSFLPQWTPYTVSVPNWQRWAKRIFNYHVPMCFVSSKYIRTFDDVLYKAPLGDCWYVAFADAEDHHAHVMYKNLKDTKDKKAVKVLYDDHEIEIKPEGDHYTVTVDGQPKLTDKNAYIHTEEDEIKFVVYKTAGKYIIGSKHYGLYVTYDGVRSIIKASNFYRGKQHGLCGNFDGEKEHEFEGPNGVTYKTPAEFTRVWGINKDGCTMP